MDALVRYAAEGLLRSGWELAIISEGRNLPWHIRRRYLGLPPLAEEFICYIDRCVRKDGQARFLTVADYAPKSWNEIEQIQLRGVKEGKAEAVRTFWDAHLPVMMTRDHRFLAICLDVQSERYGKVVMGGLATGPNTKVIAASYADLLGQIRKLGEADLYEGLPTGDLAEFVHARVAEEQARRRRGLVGRFKRLLGR